MTHEYLSMRSGNASNCMNLACESRRLCRILFTLPSNRRHRVIGSIPEEELVGGEGEDADFLSFSYACVILYF